MFPSLALDYGFSGPNTRALTPIGDPNMIPPKPFIAELLEAQA